MIDRIDVLGAPEAKRMFDEVGRQGPFALSRTLNALANATQKTVQNELGERFTLRRPDFVKRTIYRKPGEDFATKSKLEAAVRVHPDRNFLAKFEEGGTKTPRDGRVIAIPVDVRRNKSDIVAKANRPRELLKKPKVRILRDVIVQRMGRAKSAYSRVLYVLKRSVSIEPRLHMADTAKQVTEQNFDRIASDEIENALRSAR